MDVNGNSTLSVEELKKWLIGRVGDDDDVIMDKLQDEFANYFDDLELKQDKVCPGSEEYQKNMEALDTSIEKIKKNPFKVTKEKQKIHDGLRDCWFGGMTNNQGYPNGEGMLAYPNKDKFSGTFENGVLDRTGKLTKVENCPKTIEGTWKNGLMEGEMRIDTDEGGWIEGYYSHGVAHGFLREFGIKESTYGRNLLRFAGRFFRGIARGFCWKEMFGGGFLCGFVDPVDGSFSGSDIAYIYPDFETVLRGKFVEGKVSRGQMCKLIGAKIQNGFYIPVFTKAEGQIYEFEEASKKSIGKNPLLQDPWEAKRVYVDASKLEQGGDGLFAKIPFTKGSVVSFYNGIRLNTSSVLMEQRYGPSMYRCRLHAECDLDIPKGAEKLEVYKATLAHKANHSFNPNMEWIVLEHPRFGLIRAFKTLRDIEANEELLVNYSMNLGDSPEWYRIVWIKHHREYKKCSDVTIKRLLQRYTENSLKHVEIPESEELNIPEPHGVENYLDAPDDQEIEANTNKAKYIEMKRKEKQIELDEDEDMLPRVEELN